MTDNFTLDCIVRFHDVRRLPELERCVFSLVGQSYRPLNIILVLQRFTAEEIAVTHSALAPLLKGSKTPTLSMHNWKESEPVDGRAYLLNLGLKAASGRYLAFLDYDDTLFPEAYNLLISRLRKSGAAIVFASVQLMRLRIYEKFSYTEGEVTPRQFHGTNLRDLFQKNFCPLHSYVLDRQQIPFDILYFDTSLIIEEDYDFLLRICAQLKSDFSLLETFIGYYSYKTDGSNTVANNGLDSEKMTTYKRVCALIEHRRQSTYVSLPVQATMGVSNPCDQLTISEVLNMRLECPHHNGILVPSTTPLSWPGKQLHRALLLHRAILQTIHRAGSAKFAVKKAVVVYRREGIVGVRRKIQFLFARRM